MRSLRNNRRVLGAILLTLVCFVVSAAPAAAYGGASLEVQLESRVSRLIRVIDSSLSNFFQKLGIIWAEEGARIED